MKTTHYKQALESDLRSIVSIYNDIITEGGFSADLDLYDVDQRVIWFKELNVKNYGVYLVKQEHEVIGFFYFSPWRKGRRALDGTAEVSFYLKSSSRGSGTGRQILKWIVELSNEKGFNALIAILLDTNERSKHLLEISGFTVAGHFQNIVHLSDRVCGQWLMIKHLK